MQKPDSNKTYLNAVSVIAVLVLLPFSVFGGPLAGEILNEGLTVDVEDLIQVPTSSGSAPLARINMLVEVPDGSERLFINDLRGRLYVLDGGVLLTFMDMAVERPLTTTPGKATGFVSIAFHPNFGVASRTGRPSGSVKAMPATRPRYSPTGPQIPRLTLAP